VSIRVHGCEGQSPTSELRKEGRKGGEEMFDVADYLRRGEQIEVGGPSKDHGVKNTWVNIA